MRRYTRRSEHTRNPHKNSDGRYVVSVTFDESELADLEYLRRHLADGPSMSNSALFVEALTRAADDLRKRRRRARALEPLNVKRYEEIKRDDSSPVQLVMP